MSVSAVDQVQSSVDIVRDVVDDLNDVTSHDGVVHDGRNLQS